jgi:hypothetical protein
MPTQRRWGCKRQWQNTVAALCERRGVVARWQRLAVADRRYNKPKSR